MFAVLKGTRLSAPFYFFVANVVRQLPGLSVPVLLHVVLVPATSCLISQVPRAPGRGSMVLQIVATSYYLIYLFWFLGYQLTGGSVLRHFHAYVLLMLYYEYRAVVG